LNAKSVIAIIPAFNEENTIIDVINGVQKYVDEVIVVDDASVDKTANFAKERGAVVIRHTKNMGYDKSIDDGCALAKKKGASILLTFDADGQHNPAEIPLIVRPILNNEADVVVGKRPYMRRIAEFVFAIITKGSIGIDDPLCGFKAYKIDVYDRIGYFDRISSIGTQLMFEAKSNGYRLIQKTITLNKRKDNSRFGAGIKANLKIFKATINILFFLIKIR
jgi:glycosyltransferase involved in cell wall biosynthesis